MAAAVAVIVVVNARLVSWTAAVGTAGEDVDGGVTIEKIGVSDGSGDRRGLAVIVAIMAVELMVTNFWMYIVRLSSFEFGSFRYLC